MKKLFALTSAILVITFLISPAYAQDDQPPPADEPAQGVNLPTEQSGDEIYFNLLDYTEEVLYGPFDTFTYTFSLPANWEITQAGEVRLAIKIFTVGENAVGATADSAADTLAAQLENTIDGSLQVFFNDQILDTILLEQSGERVVTIPIPLETIEALDPGRDHQLIVELDAGGSCDEFDLRTRVAIHPYSLFNFPHAISAPSTDLALLPRPIFQNSFLPDQALLIVPDNPSISELQAAFTVASGFGTLTGGRLELALRSNSQVTPDELGQNHLIFVGKPANLSLLGSVAFPVEPGESALGSQGAQTGDGIIEMAVSPWNSNYVALLATGIDDMGVLKAATAVSSGQILTGDQENFVIVANIAPAAANIEQRIDQTFADLGYADRKLWRVGYSVTEYEFYLPPGQVLDNNAYLDLLFSHSKLMNYDLSGMVVTVNGKDVGSIKFNDDNADYNQTRINIPPTTTYPGYNKVRVSAELIPQDYCIDPRLGSTWVRIWPESTLHIPTSPQVISTALSFGLDTYPAPYSLHPLLSSTALIVPTGDPAAWEVAAKVAFDLGNQADPAITDLVAAFADSVPDEILGGRNLILVGLPSSLALLSEVNSALPAPLDMSSNTITQNVLEVDYRIPVGSSVGYLEIITSPWNADHVLLAVLGSNVAGLQLAGDALSNPELRTGLAGNFSIVVNDQILSADTREIAAYEAPPGTTAAEDTALTELMPETPVQGRAPWILPTMAGVLVLILIVIAIAASGWWRQRRQNA
ncbi:MAG: cellulose biosynthesis cyclic di-GMP-binding regulatory protein BcsB [Anaerolineae bacterium]|nr:cellulose biosynthesis cyclic di-GMP-binding regulatory protein BcsB [Anaerolineae bacterium]MBL6965297.1 cellulose biosynthesis cyclic di-GMP-binding regulatory protein BcsB [Anaerolineales bacterium]